MRATDADVIHLSEEHLLRRLTSRGIRTNVLVTCRELRIHRVVGYLVEQLAPPLAVGVVGPDLQLPDMTSGIWLLHDVAALNREQQVSLADWIGGAGSNVRIVSVASMALWPQVANGQFLEVLYYQLNTIVCEATPRPLRSAYDEGAAAS